MIVTASSPMTAVRQVPNRIRIPRLHRAPRGTRRPRSARLPRVPRSVLVVVAVALVLRVAWVVYAEREPAIFGDPFIYLQLARRLASNRGYGPWFSTGPTAFHPIGYPGWLAGIVWTAKLVGLDHHEPLLIGLAQAVLGTASVALVYAIAARLLGHRVALIAAALTAVFPNLVFYTGLEYSETLYLFGVLLATWLVVRADWEPAPALPVLVSFGFVVGLSALVRPFALLAMIPLGVAAARAGAHPRDIARGVAVATAVALLVLVPWTIRNAFAFHAFVPVSTNLGDTLCLDNGPGAYGGFRLLPPECEVPVRSGYAEPARNTHNLHYAIKWAIHHPLDEARLVVRRAYYGYRDDHDSLDDLAGPAGKFPPSWLRKPLGSLADVYYWLVGALALAGFVDFRRDPRRLFVLLTAASIAVVPLLLYGLPRFHVPLLPFLALGAAVTVDKLVERVRPRRQSA